MTGGELDQRVTVRQHNEVGLLSSAFNSMATQLQEIINTLEERVADRTRALETSMEVSRNLSTILDKKQLVSEVVEQVRSAFNYYYAHIYLVDDTGQNLIMVGGTGQAGEKMLAKGHKLPLGKGLVGQTAETGKIILVPDVFKEDGWLPNPLLPETKSEVSVPIVVGNQILGVLDVQNNLVAGLTQDDCDLLQSIANQVAIGLQNADLYARQERLTTIIEATTDLVAITDPTGRMLYLNRAGRRIIGLHKDEEISRKHLEHYYAEATKATVANQITATATRNGVWTGETTMVSRDGRQIPMSQVVIAHKRNGSVEFFSSIARDITERKQAEEALTRALSETQVLYDVSQALTATISLRGILENMLLALNQNGIALRANSVSLISIEVDETGQPDWGELLAVWHPKPSDLIAPVGTRYLFKELALTQIWTQDPFNPIMVSDARTDERIDEVNRTLLEGQALSTVILPLSIAGRWVGLLTINWQDPD
jgi:PAS domain S-box-containing protein